MAVPDAAPAVARVAQDAIAQSVSTVLNAEKTLIRVLHVVVAGDIGGAERFLVDLARLSDPTRVSHSVLLLTPNPALRAYFQSLRVFDGGYAPETPLAYLQRSYGRSTLDWASAIARRERTDVVHAHTLGSHVLAARLGYALNLPVMRTEHHFAHYEDFSAKYFTKHALQKTTRIVAISDFIAAYLAREVPEHAHKVVRIRNGVDSHHFAFRALSETTTGPLRFAIACRLERWKGVHLALEALLQVRDATLDIAGTGSEQATLEALTARLGLRARVRFHGRVEDVAAFYGGAHVALNASSDEPLGLSVLEALSVGRPVVAFAQGGIPEIVQDTQTGFLAKERTASALASAMQGALQARSQLEKMGSAARSFVTEHASVHAMTAAYLDAYEHMR